MKRNFVSLFQPKLSDQHGDRSRFGFLQRHFHLEFIWLRALPFGLQLFCLLIFSLTIFSQLVVELELHFTHATGVRRLQVKRVFAADDQGTVVFRRDDPLYGARGTQPVVRTIEMCIRDSPRTVG